MRCRPDTWGKGRHFSSALWQWTSTGYTTTTPSPNNSPVWKKGFDPTPVKARVQKRSGKIMAVIFFDSEEFCIGTSPPVERLWMAMQMWKYWLRDAVNRKRARLRDGRWLLLDDNARCHTAGVVTQLLQRNNSERLPHPPYSPELAPWLTYFRNWSFLFVAGISAPGKGGPFGRVREVGRSPSQVHWSGRLLCWEKLTMFTDSDFPASCCFFFGNAPLFMLTKEI